MARHKGDFWLNTWTYQNNWHAGLPGSSHLNPKEIWTSKIDVSLSQFRFCFCFAPTGRAKISKISKWSRCHCIWLVVLTIEVLSTLKRLCMPRDISNIIQKQLNGLSFWNEGLSGLRCWIFGTRKPRYLTPNSRHSTSRILTPHNVVSPVHMPDVVRAWVCFQNVIVTLRDAAIRLWRSL